MTLTTLALLACLALPPLPAVPIASTVRPGTDQTAAALLSKTVRGTIEASPELPSHAVHLLVQPPRPGWQSGAISWVASDAAGILYELQRGDCVDPVLVLDQSAHLLRSWGKGDYTLPHSIRLDPAGNVWTVDAASSDIIKYTPAGQKLLTLHVGGQGASSPPFDGTTDIAFAPNGHLFITDGYANARVLEYSPDGRRLRQWGHPGSGPGKFHLPHSIQIDENGTIYIADRENGRIQKFDLQGRFLAQIPHIGRVYSLQLAGRVLWATSGPLDQPPGAPGWLLKLDRDSGKLLGRVDLSAPRSGHGLAVLPSGEPVVTQADGLLRFSKP